MLAASILYTLALGALLSAVRAAPLMSNGVSIREEICPPYKGADAVRLSTREIDELEKRAGEEFFFRWESSAIVTDGLDAFDIKKQANPKGFDDQSYKWVSSNIATFERSKIPGRLAVMYVLPAGTRAAMVKQAADFEQSVTEKKVNQFVQKTNERDDIGIQGAVPPTKDTPTAFDAFKAKILRAVVVQVSAKGKGKTRFTTIDGKTGKKTDGASKADQKLIVKVC